MNDTTSLNITLLFPSLFELGQIVGTEGALACPFGRMLECLTRHAKGDWGNLLYEEDAAENDKAVKQGEIILSAYPINPAKPCKVYGKSKNCLWIITEADRSVTTLLLPSEY